MAKLSDYGKINASKTVVKLEEIEGKPVKLHSFTLVEGDFSEYAMIKASNEKGEEFTIMTGGTLIVEALKDAEAQKAFPLDATFVKRGKAWIAE